VGLLGVCLSAVGELIVADVKERYAAQQLAGLHREDGPLADAESADAESADAEFAGVESADAGYGRVCFAINLPLRPMAILVIPLGASGA